MKNLHEATAQQVFEQVGKHLLTQNARSVIEGNSNNCRYRGANGLSCAAGCLIADDEYDPEFEDKSWYGISWDLKACTRDHIELIAGLQNIHDMHLPEEWPRKLTLCAAKHSLDAGFVADPR